MAQHTSTTTAAADEAAFTLRSIAGEPGWCHAVYSDGSYVRVREGFRGWGV
ncbi:hypothetical protein [Clavibacter michiganensis]|uniref:hypothetical protein n=1 Tax=Clavibacter michiganensis TaxID=28447 RepID=UPI00130E474C|nr:hypothetical protein [Clavibacter michiganensis]